MADQLPYLPKAVQDALLAGPAMASPEGVTPDFDNPPNNNGLAHGVMAVCIAVSTLCILLRFYLAILSRRVRVIECLILGAFGCYLGWAYCTYRILYLIGYFVHQWDVILGKLIDLGYFVSVGGVFYSVTLPLLKVAILLEWTELFVPRGTRNYFWYTCYTLMAIQALFGIAAVVALNLICIPYKAIYDFTVAGRCFNKHNMDLTSACIHLATDVIMVFLPQRVIWGLQLSLRKKLGVSVVFSLGLLACISAILRLQVTVTYANAADSTYTLGPVVFWAFAEMTCGFVISCMPSAPRLLRETRVLHKIKARLGMRATTFKNTHGTGGSSALSMSKPSPLTASTDRYRKIDDGGVLLDNLGPAHSDSTEMLHTEAIEAVGGGKLRGTKQVLRTM
ncbi:hypothetical protein B0H67DRAFT_582799 [Lasiosphaeris hirsuta]|uniref:Rhodopsin domain-containing protein n=1 Tax=Lasiosphaeris hirsuta TaxID=260670 RepID=A0AA40AI64_9PEZI|nr:hypothetical protein B0H67DRAFT_582799 [Lasiosphaeris hirsuta]